ncbi:MAG: cytochrome c [Flavobacteriales bacterium]|nr:cytochrome c [Flavobacteriales bacterium]
MRKSVKIAGLSIVGISVLLLSAFDQPKNNFSNETPIYELLKAFGEPMPKHAPASMNEEIVKRGRDLVFEGRTIGPNGNKSKYISKFYTCVSCHSPIQEDPNLQFFDPQARLDHAAKNNLKFLQGSTFYGIANRESWYNDDYVLKYGALVEPASKDLAEATQLCAKVCSSGRYLENWELEAILAYYWSNQLKLGDLDLSDTEKENLAEASTGSNSEMVSLLKSKYARKSPATFGHSPKNHRKGYASIKEGNPENGKKIYQLSCMSCHQEGGVSGISFGQTKLDFKKFKRNIGKKSNYNIYDIVRKGTYAGQGKPRYMPLYPEERMSDQQLEDLRVYIEQEAK